MIKTVRVANYKTPFCAPQKIAGGAVLLENIPGSEWYLGVGYIDAMIRKAEQYFPARDVGQIFHAGDDSAMAQAALHSGWKYVRFSGEELVYKKLQAIAEQMHATILTEKEML